MKLKVGKNRLFKDVKIQRINSLNLTSLLFSDRNYHLINVSKGKLNLHLGEENVVLQAGEFLFVHRYMRFKIISSDQVEGLAISLKRNFLQQLLSDIHNEPLILKPSALHKSSHSFKASLLAFITAYELEEDSDLLRDLLIELIIHLSGTNKTIELSQKTILISQALVHVRQDQKIKLDIMADNLLLTTFEFVSGFLNHMKLSPHIYHIAKVPKEKMSGDWQEELKKNFEFNRLITSLLK